MNPIVLASSSSIRAELLTNAGVSIDVHPARVDEMAIKQAMIADAAAPRDIADALADLKAQRISMRFPDQLVLGADQVLVHRGELLDKPTSLSEAREQLLNLAGSSHELLSAAVIYEAGEPVWRHIGRAQMVIRTFSDQFLDDYLEAEQDHVLHSVGAYRLEGRGAQLFSRVQGDYFSVLGLPLLEVLGFLRARKVLIE